jgi:hypothetical protein
MFVYVASPYTHQDNNIQGERYRLACAVIIGLMTKGISAFSPVAMNVPIAMMLHSQATWDQWRAFCSEIMSKCDELIVVTLPGWRESKGVQLEIEAAEKLGKPITYKELEELL